jgi:hypothetical protein
MLLHHRRIGLASLTALLLMLALAATATAQSPPGNSGAARACQQGGYEAYSRADGTRFRNTGECVSYAARGGSLVRLPDLTVTKSCSPTTIASGGSTTCTFVISNAADAGPATVSTGMLLLRDAVSLTSSNVRVGARVTAAPTLNYRCEAAITSSTTFEAFCRPTQPVTIPAGGTLTFAIEYTYTNFAATPVTVTDVATVTPDCATSGPPPGGLVERNCANNSSPPVVVTVNP